MFEEELLCSVKGTAATSGASIGFAPCTPGSRPAPAPVPACPAPPSAAIRSAPAGLPVRELCPKPRSRQRSFPLPLLPPLAPVSVLATVAVLNPCRRAR